MNNLEGIKKDMKNVNIDFLFGAIEFSSDGIYICDEKGKTLYVNPAYERISGLKKDKILGKNLDDLLKENAFNISASLKVLETKKPISLIHRYISGKTALTTATPIYNNKDEIIGVVCNTRNIEELINLRKELEDVNLIKQRYSEELELLRKTQYSTEGLIYKSMAMEETLDLASTAAVFDSTVLISGESGTGKEVFANFIYRNSKRKDKPFIKVNCAAIPKNLFESELFGYMPGSFTGALDTGRAGKFELANGGTILLDEIGELDMPIQSKLLRVIQEQEVYRLGGTKPIKLDVRILTSTNRNLEEEIKKGSFREDLYFRLNVVPIKIPPLRERVADISEMIKYFMTKLNSKYNRNVIISKKAEDALINYSWPGNVRELQNVIEYMFIMNDREEIGFGQLPDKILNDYVLMNVSKDEIQNENKLGYLMDVYEKIILESALSKHSSMRKTAETLGIHVSTLSRKANKHNIDV